MAALLAYSGLGEEEGKRKRVREVLRDAVGVAGDDGDHPIAAAAGTEERPAAAAASLVAGAAKGGRVNSSWRSHSRKNNNSAEMNGRGEIPIRKSDPISSLQQR